MHHRAKFHADRSSHCQDMAIFLFFNIAAVGHIFLKVKNFNYRYRLLGQYV